MIRRVPRQAGGIAESMAFDFQTSSEFPGLREWIIGQRWQEAFDPATLLRSRPYVSERMIRNVGNYHETTPRAAVLFATIHGTSPVPYETRVSFRQVKEDWKIDARCSCPVEFSCKHAAALLTYVASGLGGQPDGGLALMAPALRDWLKSIETAAKPTAGGTVKRPPKEVRFLAYCIERYGHRESDLSLIHI